MNTKIIFMILINIIIIGLWLYILNYMHNLQKIGCKCAENWRRNAIMYFIIYYVAILALKLVGGFNGLDKSNISRILMTIFIAVYSLITIASIIIIYQYVHELKAKNCSCSEDMARTILEFINYVQIIALVLTLVSVIYILVLLNHTMKYIIKKK